MTEADKAWNYEAIKRSSNCDNPEQSQHRMMGFMDHYRSRLREQLSENLNDYIRMRDGWKEESKDYATYDLMVREYTKLLQLLDTITP